MKFFITFTIFKSKLLIESKKTIVNKIKFQKKIIF